VVVGKNRRIPKELQAVTYKIIGLKQQHSDGEERTIPVFDDRMLVTKRLPICHELERKQAVQV